MQNKLENWKMVFEKEPLNRRLSPKWISLNRDCTLVCFQMQTGLVFCPGHKKMTNVSNNKQNALVWSNPEEGRQRSNFPRESTKRPCKKILLSYQGVNNQGHTHIQISKSDEKNLNTYLFLNIVLIKSKVFHWIVSHLVTFTIQTI